MAMIQEFKKFALKGNAVDMAVGIIIGGAFGKIVASVVNDMIMPVVGQFLGGVDFRNFFYALDGNRYESLEAAREAGAAVVAYGSFTQTVVDFVIIAFVIFLMVRAMNNMRKKEEEKPSEPPKPSAEAELLTEIRDALKKSA